MSDDRNYTREAMLRFLEDREDYLLGIAVFECDEPTIRLGELERRFGLASPPTSGG
ncbi:MAG TPA: hypothetical protein VG028_06085 [Terriglobia bacterium]|nr:hypothetical protein [Terriglobia bacterium]